MTERELVHQLFAAMCRGLDAGYPPDGYRRLGALLQALAADFKAETGQAIQARKLFSN